MLNTVGEAFDGNPHGGSDGVGVLRFWNWRNRDQQMVTGPGKGFQLPRSDSGRFCLKVWDLGIRVKLIFKLG